MVDKQRYTIDILDEENFPHVVSWNFSFLCPGCRTIGHVWNWAKHSAMSQWKFCSSSEFSKLEVDVRLIWFFYFNHNFWGACISFCQLLWYLLLHQSASFESVYLAHSILHPSMSVLPQCGRPGWNSWFLALSWHISGYVQNYGVNN